MTARLLGLIVERDRHVLNAYLTDYWEYCPGIIRGDRLTVGQHADLFALTRYVTSHWR